MIHKSILGDVDGIPTGNAVEHLFNSPALNDPKIQDMPFFISSETGESITVAEYKRLVPRVAGIFQKHFSINKGDVVALFGINHLYTPAIHHGTISLGAVLSPANAMYSSEELAHQFRMTRPKLVIVYDPLKKTVIEAGKKAMIRPRIITFTDLFKMFRRVMKDNNAFTVAPIPVNNKETHAYYCFSSGTSGLPKGVITTHYNMSANVLQVNMSHGKYMTPEYPQSSVLPMSHIFGLNTGVWSAPYCGKTTCIFPKFEVEDFVAKVCKYNLKSLYLVPPIILLLGKLDILEKYPKFGETVEMIVSGAAPISKETIGLVTSKCPKIRIYQGYGLTETTPTTHTGTVRDFKYYDQASIGWLLPSAEALLVDPESGKVVTGFDKPGELWLRGPMVMAGYLNNPKATNEVITKDAWFKTGDVAIVKEDNQFYIVDRIKELIKSNGHQVAPAELESVLLTSSHVIDSAVIGVYNNDKTSEMPRAYLVLQKGTDPKDVVTWFNKRVAKHKRLWGGAVVVDQIPKSASGKILRRNLKDRSSQDTNVVVGADLAKL